MRYSQIQTINDFNAYLQECKVIARPHYCRIGKENESHHSPQSLKNKLQQLIKSEPFFPGVEIHETLEGRVIIEAGMSENDMNGMIIAVNWLIQSVGLLTALESEVKNSKPKGVFSKIDRLFTRIALHCRYGSQPKSSKLLGRVRDLIAKRMDEEIAYTKKGLELPFEAKKYICDSLIALRGDLNAALTANQLIDLQSVEESITEEFSSDESTTITFEQSEQVPHIKRVDSVALSNKKLKPVDKSSRPLSNRSAVMASLKGNPKAALRPPSQRRRLMPRDSLKSSLVISLTNMRSMVAESSATSSPIGVNWLEDN